MAEGFLAPRRVSPTRVAVVAGLHAAVLGAIILAPPEVVRMKLFTPLQIYDVKDQPPPPPTRIPPPPTRATPSTPTSVTPTVPLPSTPPFLSDTRPTPSLIEVPTGNIPDVAPPVPPVPVLTTAQVDARYADALQPDYPAAMQRQQVEGFATVRVLIGVDGRVKDVQPVTATDPAFAEATARQARRAWRFVPATRDGKPVESWREMTVRFRLT